ncbi:tRNA-dependent cyclodipeptide synthase [Candidatus Woesearchaeota archaeon]|nr:tRNA-dependent cyclodipeptide synthase [Candidatus Woesearchaeota archaeon]
MKKVGKSIGEEKNLDEQGYALVWMSAGNSYFKEEIIQKILKFTAEHFLKTIVIAPDEPAQHTFKALGYEGNEVSKKARLNANLLQNRAKRVITSMKDKSKFQVIEWIEEIAPNLYYQEKLKQITLLYSKNSQFRSDANEVTREVLMSKSNEEFTADAVNEGVYYLLKELAFVMASPTIFNTQKVTYVYHKEWPIFQKLITGVYDGKVRGNLRFLLHS